MAAINQAIKEGKAAQTERVLRNPNVALRGIVPDCAKSYQQALEGAAAKKHRPGNSSGVTSLHAACLWPPPSLLGSLEFLLRGHSLLGSP